MTKQFVCLLLLLSGAVRAVAGAVPTAAPRKNLISEWQQLLAGEIAAESLVQPQAGTAPVRALKGGSVELPVNFEGTSFERVSWDLPVDVDMTRSKGVSFDFFCADRGPFSSFVIYLHADGRWLTTRFSPSVEGEWNHIEIRKAAFKLDQAGGDAGDFNHVDRIRISGWRLRDVNTTCALANVGLMSFNPDVLIIQGVSSAENGEDEKQYLVYAENIARTLDSLDVEYCRINDRDLTAAALKGLKVVMVSYSTSLPQTVMALLQSYTENGGRLMAFYTLPSGLKELIGVKQGAWIKDPDGHFSGFSKSVGGGDGQPEFAPQRSWNANVYTPLPDVSGGEVLAVWRSGSGEDTEYPAIVKTGKGVVFGHVWLGGSDPRSDQLMMSVLGNLTPDIWKKKAERAFARIGLLDGMQSYADFSALFGGKELKTVTAALFKQTCDSYERAKDALRNQRWAECCGECVRAEDLAVKSWCSLWQPVAGEHRAFWCHSAFGLGNGRNWDESVNYLKEHGFNVIIPNMSWGASAYYPSEVLPVHVSVQERGDQIEACLAACRKYGVECHIWKVCWNTGHRVPQEIEKRLRAEGRIQVSDKGDDHQLWLCPSHPENQRMEIESQLEVVRNYDVDGVHFDYIRYPGSNYCYCKGCRERFESSAGVKVAVWPKDVIKGGDLFERYLEFRRSNITKVVRTVAEQAGKIRKGVEISAAVFRSAPADRNSIGQDWQLWCEKGWLDFVCPMDYIDSNADYRNVVEVQREFAGDVPLYPGIGLSCWKDGSSYAVKLSRQIMIVREAGLKGFTVFNYDHNAEQVLPYVKLGVTAE